MNDRSRPTRLFISFATTLLGILLAAVPVALWVAPTQDLFVLVLVGAGACSLLLIRLSDLGAAAAPSGTPGDAGRRD
jgi:hypothetical protein